MNQILETPNDVLREIQPFLMQNASINFVYNRDMVTPTFEDPQRCPTAAVGFGRDGKNIEFIMNKEFMEKQNYFEKCFIFAHEALHVMFNHGSRGFEYLETLPPNQGKRSNKLLNYAMDICINEILMDQFFAGYLDDMPLLDTLVTLKNLKEKEGLVLPKGKNFIFYYEEILKHIQQKINSGEMALGEGGFDLDGDYTSFGDQMGFDEKDREAIEAAHKRSGSMTENSFSKNNSKSQGSGSASYKEVVTTYEKMSLKDALERFVIDQSMSKIDLKAKEKVSYNWYGADRRNVLNNSRKITNPIRSVKYHAMKSKVIIYCDVSGSVSNYTKKFINIVNSIDNQKCDVIFKVWADSVSDVYYNKDGVAKWKDCGGGTSIESVIGDYTANHSKEKVDCIVVLTDGEYTNITNKKMKDCEKWVFFMIPDTNGAKNVLPKSKSVTIDW